jgi:hypothetical protein
MTVATSRAPTGRRRALRLAFMLIATVALVACGDGKGGSPRPTDPRQILVNAIGATAALPTLRLHAEIAANMGGLVGQGNAVMTVGLDADVDLATRQFAGRATTQVPQNLGVNGVAGQQVSDVIVTTTATFNRNSQTGRWQKIPAGIGGGFAGGPTNTQVATMIANLLSNPAITYELLEASACSLGTCDHVLAHIDGQTLAAAIGPLLGMPLDQATQSMIPSFNVDVLVDQATSVISELRTEISMAGSSERIFVSLSNPGQPVQIAPPPPALTDDFGANFGGGGIGPVETTILEQVGNELPTDEPAFPEPSAPGMSDTSSPAP